MISTERMDKVSVMMLITSFHPSPMGGSELQAFKLAKALKAKGLNVYVVTLGERGHKKEEYVEGIKVFRIRSIFNPGSFRPTKKSDSPVKIEFKQNDECNFALTEKKSIFSLIPYFIFYYNVLFLLRRKKESLHFIYVPIMEWTAFIGTLLGNTLNKKVVIKDSTMNGITNLSRYPLGNLMQKTLRKNSYFVAMTTAIKNNLLRVGIPDKKIFSIPNGVILPQVSSERNVERNKFTFVGNLYQQPAKGVDVLLKAWKIVIKNKKDAQLFIIGDGNIKAYNDYAEKMNISGNVHFLGKQRDFQHHLRESMAFILPSRREGMSNALLEAMALGLPCIATDISGSQDLIEDNVNGLLVPVENEVSLAEAIVYIYDHFDQAELMGREARKTIEKEYTMDIVAQKYFQLFQSGL